MCFYLVSIKPKANRQRKSAATKLDASNLEVIAALKGESGEVEPADSNPDDFHSSVCFDCDTGSNPDDFHSSVSVSTAILAQTLMIFTPQFQFRLRY
jgi:hypothetical protein